MYVNVSKGAYNIIICALMVASQEFRELEEHLDSEFGKVDLQSDDDQGKAIIGSTFAQIWANAPYVQYRILYNYYVEQLAM